MSASSKKKLRKEIKEAKITERQKQEQNEAKKVKRLTFAFIAVLVIVACIFVSIITIDYITTHGVIEKHTIAATIGDHKLNSITMNYFYRDAVDDYYSYYTQYISAEDFKSIGFDVEKPLNQQVQDQKTGATWADYFLEQATVNARFVYAMYDLAKANNFTLPEADKATITSELNNLQFAVVYGYESADAYLSELYCNGATAKNYEEYLTIQATAYAYYNHYSETLSYDDAALRAYDEAHPNQYDSYDYNYYYLSADKFLPVAEAESTDPAAAEPDTSATEDDATVAEPESTAVEPTDAVEPDATEPEVTEAEATEPEATTAAPTYTEEQKQAARDAAKAAAEELKKATTVEELDSAIAALPFNKDVENPTKSTLAAGRMHTDSSIANYVEFLSAAERKAGDVEIFPNKTTSKDADGKDVEIINGYYIVMFAAKNDNKTSTADVRQFMIAYEGGTDNGFGGKTYTEEEKKAAYDKAEKLLNDWKTAGSSKDAFITMVKDNGGDSETGGLVENVNKSTSYAYADWALNSERKAGDTTIVHGTDGCYVVYYEGISKLNYRDYLITQDKKQEDVTAWETSVIDAVKIIKGKTSKINLDLIYSPAGN